MKIVPGAGVTARFSKYHECRVEQPVVVTKSG